MCMQIYHTYHIETILLRHFVKLFEPKLVSKRGEIYKRDLCHVCRKQPQQRTVRKTLRRLLAT